MLHVVDVLNFVFFCMYAPHAPFLQRQVVVLSLKRQVTAPEVWRCQFLTLKETAKQLVLARSKELPVVDVTSPFVILLGNSGKTYTLETSVCLNSQDKSSSNERKWQLNLASSRKSDVHFRVVETCEALKSRICEDLESWTREVLKSWICEDLESWTREVFKSRICEDLESWTCEAL
jgi:hypothetical protein